MANVPMSANGAPAGTHNVVIDKDDVDRATDGNVLFNEAKELAEFYIRSIGKIPTGAYSVTVDHSGTATDGDITIGFGYR